MRAQNSFFKFIYQHLLTIVSCVLIVTLGIVYLAYSSPGTTTIGEDISTTNLTVSGNATTTDLYVSGSSILSNLLVSNNSTTTNLFVSSSSTLGTIISGIWQGSQIQDSYIADNLTISNGTINNTPIGNTTPSTGSFTTLNSSATTTLAVSEGKISIGTSTPEFKLTITNDGGIIATGTYGSGATLQTSGAGTRFIWYPRKAALRAGYVSGAHWDDANIGSYSVAFGNSNRNSGYAAVICGGELNTTGGTYAVIAGGGSNSCAGTGCTVCGGVNNSVGDSYGTVCGGYNNKAAGYNSFSAGRYMQLSADADRTFVFGYSDSAISITQSDSVIFYNHNYPLKFVIGATSSNATLEIKNTTSTHPILVLKDNTGTSKISVEDDGDITGNLIPSTDNTYALGSSSQRWAHLYAASSTIGDLIFLNNFRIVETKPNEGIQALIVKDQRNEEVMRINEKGELQAKKSNFEELQTKNLQTQTLNTTHFSLGTPTHPTGITIYDRATGKPYCLYIENDKLIKQKGECK